MFWRKCDCLRTALECITIKKIHRVVDKYEIKQELSVNDGAWVLNYDARYPNSNAQFLEKNLYEYENGISTRVTCKTIGPKIRRMVFETKESKHVRMKSSNKDQKCIPLGVPSGCRRMK